MGIQQWTVIIDSGRAMRFEQEEKAVCAAFDVATHVTPGIVQFPNGDEYVVLKRHQSFTVTVSKVV